MPTTKLIIAASEHDADMLYATGFHAPDPFLFLLHRGKTSIVLNSLEIDRGKREARVDEVVPYESIAPAPKDKPPLPFIEVLARFLVSRKIKTAQVPGSFPLAYAHALAKHGIKTQPVEGFFWPERECKNADEVKMLEKALRITEAGMARGIEVLKAAEIGKTLRWGGKPLTSEILRAEIDIAMLRLGAVASRTIVAGGEHACDPHEIGHGPLKPHQLIILDIFPRHVATGYFGDMTRTVVRGKANDAQRALWNVVLEGQKLALKEMCPGADGGKIHSAVQNLFTDRGYPTEVRDGRHVGFFHGTGHGLGLEIHEEPRFSRTTFKPGQVITVEPGLYYPGVGGVRHEDVALVTPTGNRVLTRFPKPFEI